MTELYQRGEEARARALYSHNLQVVRRSREPGLQVSSEGVQPARDVHGLTAVPPQQEPLAASQCQNIWTCLESVEDRRELARDRDEGWINALDLVTKVVDHSRYAIRCNATHYKPHYTLPQVPSCGGPTQGDGGGSAGARGEDGQGDGAGDAAPLPRLPGGRLHHLTVLSTGSNTCTPANPHTRTPPSSS